MTDEALKEVAKRKIEDLEKEEERLEKELSAKRASNMADWEKYGSRLCSGAMLKEEENIQTEIDSVREEISLLRRFVDGVLNVLREEKLKTRLADTTSQIVNLKRSRELIEEELAEIERVRDLLN